MELEEIRQFMKENGISMEEVPDETLGEPAEEQYFQIEGNGKMPVVYHS